MGLKSWNKHVLGNLYFQIESLRVEVVNLDSLIDQRYLYEEEIQICSSNIVKLFYLLKFKVFQVLQRYKSKWLKERDFNCGFTHASVNSRSKEYEECYSCL